MMSDIIGRNVHFSKRVDFIMIRTSTRARTYPINKALSYKKLNIRKMKL